MVVPWAARGRCPTAAAAAAQRAWDLNWPFRVKKRLHGFNLSATDHAWSVGEGAVVEGPVRALLMLVSGRHVVLPELSGPGADELRARLQPSRVS